MVVRERAENLNMSIIEGFTGKVACEQRLEGGGGVSCVRTPWTEGTAYTKAEVG